MESNNTTIDVGTLSVYNCSILPEAGLDAVQICSLATKEFHLLKEKLKETIKSFEEEQNLRKLEHKLIDFEKNPNEIKLPRTELPLPRLLPYNPDNYKTKWEKFAEENGIQKKKKRSRMLWSEEIKDWVPRWGKGSLKKVQGELDIIREVKDGEDPYSNPFQADKQEKKIHKKKQEFQTLKNDLRKQGIHVGKAMKEEEKKNKKVKRMSDTDKKKEKIQKSIEVAKKSTASMGKYDAKGKLNEEKKKMPRHGARVNFSSNKAEATRNRELLKSILS